MVRLFADEVYELEAAPSVTVGTFVSQFNDAIPNVNGLTLKADGTLLDIVDPIPSGVSVLEVVELPEPKQLSLPFPDDV